MTRAVRLTSCAAAVAIVLLAGACGSSGGSKPNAAADLALAKGAVLTDSDAPTGYTPTPHESSGDPPEQTKRDFANCMHTEFTFFDDVKGQQEANGPDLKNTDDGGEIDNSITIDPSKSDVDKGYELMQKSEAEECLGKLFDTVVKQAQQQAGGTSNATFGDATVGRYAVDGVGDRGTGFKVVIPVSAGGDNTNFYIDFNFVQRGRAGIFLSSQKAGTPPDRDQEMKLLKLMSDRLGQKAP